MGVFLDQNLWQFIYLPDLCSQRIVGLTSFPRDAWLLIPVVWLERPGGCKAMQHHTSSSRG